MHFKWQNADLKCFLVLARFFSPYHFKMVSAVPAVNQTNRFLMVSFLVLLRSLRVNILKQLFTSGEVNIFE